MTETADKRQPTCAERIREHWHDRITDLRDLQKRKQSRDGRAAEEAFEEFWNYGLGFDYVTPGTFEHQREGYWRWQLSWGGPSDEFRFFADPIGSSDPHRIEYWFMDWFDGAKLNIKGEDEKLLAAIFGEMRDAGLVEQTYLHEKDM
jgi:hypothetical protein